MMEDITVIWSVQFVTVKIQKSPLQVNWRFYYYYCCFSYYWWWYIWFQKGSWNSFYLPSTALFCKFTGFLLSWHSINLPGSLISYCWAGISLDNWQVWLYVFVCSVNVCEQLEGCGEGLVPHERLVSSLWEDHFWRLFNLGKMSVCVSVRVCVFVCLHYIVTAPSGSYQYARCRLAIPSEWT